MDLPIEAIVNRIRLVTINRPPLFQVVRALREHIMRVRDGEVAVDMTVAGTLCMRNGWLCTLLDRGAVVRNVLLLICAGDVPHCVFRLLVLDQNLPEDAVCPFPTESRVMTAFVWHVTIFAGVASGVASGVSTIDFVVAM